MVETEAFTSLFQTIGYIATLVFVLASTFSAGLSLTAQQILDPLHNIKLVLLALVANFILVPAIAQILLYVFSLPQPLAIGLFILGTVAGSPFVLKLTKAARGDTALASGLMILLMVITTFYLPVVLPIFFPGIETSAWDLIKSMAEIILIPLALGLLVRARYDELAEELRPFIGEVSNLAFLVLIISYILAYLPDMLRIITETHALFAGIIFVIGSYASGYFLGGPDRSYRQVLGFGTSQRNISVALAIAGSNFRDPYVTIMVFFVSIVALILLMVFAQEIGYHHKKGEKAHLG
ncbi:bile acid:sodium symporter family protein [Methanosarcina sp.]|uniref:bile acid:sodium symporter family protein n=1 Tax=Methanosarcina sp. TaxID=2213 RepID=UPI002AB82D82|nr:bile acid:sodium symporter [Methanosarcina sp.]MDY9925329.1 bile acid:sodium symporter [Methanosarcina sp.]